MRFPWLLRILTLSSLLLPPAITSRLTPAVHGGEPDPAAPSFSPQQRTHWDFRPSVHPPWPRASNPNWMRKPVNGFIHARLDQAGLSPAPFTEQLAGDLLPKRLTSQSSVINPQSAIDFLRMAASFGRSAPIHQTMRGRQINPDNRRLEAETLRDNALAVAGTLNPALGGPSIRVRLEAEIYELIFAEVEPDGLWPATPEPRQHGRRSLYLYNKRNVRLPLLEAFDQPDILTPCPVGPDSTFAPQALIRLYGPFVRP